MWLALLKGWTRSTSFIGKEVVEVVRRPGALFSLIIGPFLIMGLFGIGYSGQYRPLNTIIVVPADSSLPTDSTFYQQAAGSAINVLEVTNDQAAAEQELQKQQIDMVVSVPADVQSQFQAGQQSVIRVEFNQLDPTRDNYTRFVIEQAVNQLNQAIIAQVVGAGQQYVLQTTGNQQATSIPPEVAAAPTRADAQNIAPLQPTVVAFFAPAVLALMLQHMAVTLTALSFVRERRAGTIELFRVSPSHPRDRARQVPGLRVWSARSSRRSWCARRDGARACRSSAHRATWRP